MKTALSQHVTIHVTRVYRDRKSRVQTSVDLGPALSRCSGFDALNKLLGDELVRLEMMLTAKEQAQAKKDAQ
jgi:hypothetical protein